MSWLSLSKEHFCGFVFFVFLYIPFVARSTHRVSCHGLYDTQAVCIVGRVSFFGDLVSNLISNKKIGPL